MFSTQSEVQVFAQLKEQWSDDNHLVAVNQLLPRAVANHGTRLALIGPERVLTYHQWWYAVLLFAFQLREQGVKKGSRVLLYANNSCEFYVAYFAIWHLGAVVVPLNVYLHEQEMAGIIRDSQPDVIITVSSTTERMNVALELVPTVSCPHIVLTSDVWDAHHYSAARLSDLDTRVVMERFKLDDTAVILYTSGTTGVPKGVMLSSRNVMTNTLQVRARLQTTVGADHTERFFSVLPLFHVFAQNACMWLPVSLGAAIIIVPKIDRRTILQGLQHAPTLFFGFPALYGLLVLMRSAPLDSVRMFVCGADALPDKIRMAFSLVYGRKICAGYGLTEASPVVAVDGDNQDYPTNEVGQLLAGVTAELRDATGTQAIPGQVGTLWVQGDNVMQGYYNAPEATAQVLVDGWLNTGDLARQEADGSIAIVGRQKDIIINKGFNIYPQEVENVLLRHPAVIKAAVVGKTESDVGQIPVAYVALRDGTKVQAAELAQFCRQNLASYKVPRTVNCLEDLPMTATGKIDKKQLQ